MKTVGGVIMVSIALVHAATWGALRSETPATDRTGATKVGAIAAASASIQIFSDMTADCFRSAALAI
ncbi:MAG: hypothetical protein AAFQ96_09220, partial [Pseudomonadota bacterium]